MPYLLQETFEGTGLPSGWTESNTGTGTLEYDYTTAPAPLQGTESARIQSDSTNSNNQIGVTTSSMTSTADCWLYMMVSYTQTANASFAMLDGLGAVAATFWIDGSTNRFRVRNGDSGSGSGEAEESRAPGGIYHCWLHNNGTTAELYVSTDGTRPASPTVTNTGSTNESVESLSVSAVQVGAGGFTIFDNIRIADEELTDNGDLAGGPSVTLGWTSPALYDSGGNLLVNQPTVRVVISSTDTAAADYDSGTTLTTDASGILTVNSELIGALSDPISPTVWHGDENYTFTGQTVIDTSA